jgi:hypothetical protein
MEKLLAFACPICGRKTDRPVSQLVEGAPLQCPFCKLTLTLHGCMWEEVQREIRGMKEAGGRPPGEEGSD